MRFKSSDIQGAHALVVPHKLYLLKVNRLTLVPTETVGTRLGSMRLVGYKEGSRPPIAKRRNSGFSTNLFGLVILDQGG